MTQLLSTSTVGTRYICQSRISMHCIILMQIITLLSKSECSVACSCAANVINKGLVTSAAAANMDQSKEQMQPKADNLTPEISPEAQKQCKEAGVPPCKPTGTLQDLDASTLVEKRNQMLWEQAQRGEQPGLMLMQDALSGENKAKTWGNEPTNIKPERQN